MRIAMGLAVASAALLAVPVTSAQAYDAAPGTVYELGADACLKGRGNCVIYAKSTQLPNGRLLAAFERSTVPESGTAVGQTVPIMKSDDDGATWQPLAQVAAPAFLSDDPAVDEYTSNWTNPYLYVLPEPLGDLEAGTVLLATVVSGEDEYYVERKAADPNWVPTNDGDRRDVAIALYASSDAGATWSFENIVATGGWQGGSAGNIGVAVASANVSRQVDPVWEPHLYLYDGQLVAHYSDENDYLGYDRVTGVPTLDPDNDTTGDPGAQILVHKTWNGQGDWSDAVVDVAGTTFAAGGKNEIGGGRPGMTTVAETADGRWMMTFEYFGGGSNVRYKLADTPLDFYSDGDVDGTPIGSLPVTAGSRALAAGGSPVITTLPDGRMAYNAAGSGNVWINPGGRSDGTWTEYQTPLGGGYSRTIQYVEGTGRVQLFQGTWGGPLSGSLIRTASVDFGASDGAYYRLVNRKTGQVIGTGGKTNDANIGNADVPDVRLEPAQSGADTQYWHLTTKPDGKTTLLNRAGGRAAAIWTGNPTVGQRIGQWVDEGATGLWNVVDAGDGYVRFQSARNPAVFLAGTTTNAALTLQNANTDGSQDWQLVQLAPTDDSLEASRRSSRLVPADEAAAGLRLELDASALMASGASRTAGATGTVYLLDSAGQARRIAEVAFDADSRGSTTLPADAVPGPSRLAVVFDEAPLVWDALTVSAPTAFDVAVTAGTTCVARKVVVTATLTNTGDAPVSATFESAYGSRTIAQIAPGADGVHAFSTRKASVPAGTITATVQGLVDGQPVVRTLDAGYSAAACN